MANLPAPPAGMDADAVRLAQAIRQHESGGNYNAKGASGESGAFQWMPGTWKANAKEVLGDENAAMTPDNQKAVAYVLIKKDKDSGLNPAQIAAKWNSGSPEGWENKIGTNSQGVQYNVPAYVKSVTDIYQKLKAEGGGQVAGAQTQTPIPSAAQVADEQSASKNGAWFPAETGDSPITAGLKTAGNLIPSAFNFGKGVISALNPLHTIKNIAAIPGAFKEAVDANQGNVGQTLKYAFGAAPGHTYEALVPEAGRQLIAGDIEGAQRSVTNDPVGSVAPFVFAARGAAKGVDTVTGKLAEQRMGNYVENIAENTKNGVPIPKGGTDFAGAFDEGVSRAAGAATAPVKYAFGKAGDLVGGTARYGVSKVTGFNPETISTIRENPEAFTPEAMASMTRKSLGEEVGSSLKERSAAVSETGSEYGSLRGSGTQVKVDPNYIDRTISENTGLTVKNGKLTATGKSNIRDASDIRALQNLYDLWKPEFKKGALTADEFLNFRTDLGNMAKYGRELTSSKPLQNLSSIIRGKLNTEYRAGFDGLKELDEQFGPLTADYRRLAKDFIDPKTGELKDAAINRIANAAGKGKDQLLGRLEEIKPGITHRIRVLKAIEDVQNIHKVGTYTKSAIEGGSLIGGIATGNIALIAASIATLLLSQPEVAVRMIRSYGGGSSTLAGKVLQLVKKGAGAVNNLPETASQPIQASSVFGRPQQALPTP